MSTQAESRKTADRVSLAEALADVRVLLEHFVRGIGEQAPHETPAGASRRRKRGAGRAVADATAVEASMSGSESGTSPLSHICASFGLSTFERQILLLCVGVEMDSAFPALCAQAHGDSRMANPTFGLALTMCPDAHWSALAPTRPLRHWRLIELGSAERLTAAPLRIDERVLHYIAGVAYFDEQLRGFVEPIAAPRELPASHEFAISRVIEVWSRTENGSAASVIQMCGNDHAGKRAVAAATCAAIGGRLMAMRAADLPSAPAERDNLARLWERESLISGSVLLIDDEESGGGLIPFLEITRGPVIVASREPIRSCKREVVRIDVDRPSAAEQKAIWHHALGPAADRLNGHLDLLSTQFDMSYSAIAAASQEALQRWSSGEATELGRLLWDASKAQVRPRLDDLAHRIKPAATWDDLVLPEAQIQVLRNIAAHVRRRALVYEHWGFAEKGARGLGISALFSGSSGTGKTMAAEVLANELHLDLYRIDLSSMVSKYIGETEKNLRRVFDAAEQGGAILLFDEADALFGKRSEVKDSHDRYANIEVSYLLQRIEAYRGLAILTSNLKNSLDQAFLRRVRFIVHFPFPDTSQRIEIWRRIFPEETPTDGLNLEQLARLNLSGGNIRNLALNAAFLAADGGEPVRMGHLLRAAHSEYAKLEKPLGEAEVEGWA